VSWHAAPLIALLAVPGCKDQGSHRDPATASSPEDAAVPAPAFTSFRDVASARGSSEGRTALLQLRRLFVRPDQVVAAPCDAGRDDLVFFSYTPAQRDLVRGLPFDEKGCGAVVVRVTLVDAPGFHGVQGVDGGAAIAADPGTLVEGRALDFPGVAPRSSPAPPQGIDYTDVDEIGFAGEKAEGKVAEISARIGSSYDLTLLYPCGRAGSFVVAPLVGSPKPKTERECKPRRFRVHYSSVVLSAKEYRFRGDMLDAP
jgi:hypothetical protein